MSYNLKDLDISKSANDIENCQGFQSGTQEWHDGEIKLHFILQQTQVRYKQGQYQVIRLSGRVEGAGTNASDDLAASLSRSAA